MGDRANVAIEFEPGINDPAPRGIRGGDTDMTNHPNRTDSDLAPRLADYFARNMPKIGGMTRTTPRIEHALVALRHLADGSYQLRYEWYRGQKMEDDDEATFAGYLPVRLGASRVAEIRTFAADGPELQGAIASAMRALVSRMAWLPETVG